MFDIDENTMVITTVDIINKKKKENVLLEGRSSRFLGI